MTGPVDLLLSRLNSVRKSGRGWTARCPAHEDRTASLSVTEGNDGRALVHCFAMCPVGDVLGAIGLQLADLFPYRERRDLSPMERHQRREFAQTAQTRAACNALAIEARIVLFAASDLLAGRAMDWDDYVRLTLAAERIDDAKAVLV